MKKLLCMILLISAIMLSSCSSLGFGASMPDLETYAAFENDTWLIIDHFLINKQDQTVCLLEANTDTDDLPSKVWGFYYYGPYAYEYIFEESSFKEYTYLKTASTKNSEPSIQFLIALKNAFGICLDDFLFSDIDISNEISYDKFIGNYMVYYYNNNSYKGEVHVNISNTLK